MALICRLRSAERRFVTHESSVCQRIVAQGRAWNPYPRFAPGGRPESEIRAASPVVRQQFADISAMDG